MWGIQSARVSGLVDKLTVGYTECQGEWISRQVDCGAIQSARGGGLVDKLTVGYTECPGEWISNK